MKYYIISGEASGDLHGANLIAQLKNVDAQANFRCWGGDRMAAHGAEIVKHYRDLAFMGFVEVLLNLKTILGNLKFCQKDILAYKPDVLILIDYPGFNLRMAKFAKQHGLKVVYYISPQIWAWKQSRVHEIKKYVDRMLTILPFENEFYARYNYSAHFVGHPLLDAIEQDDFLTDQKAEYLNSEEGKPLIALLPGSRKQEVKRMLPVMIEAASLIPNARFVIAGAPSLPKDFYQSFLNNSHIELVFNQTYQVLRKSNAAMVTSGTATLETALLKTPQVVCYKATPISYHIAKRLVKVPYISLVNLIMNREIVKELIQNQCSSTQIASEINKILGKDGYRTSIEDGYKELEEKLGGSGASAKAAQLIKDFINP